MPTFAELIKGNLPEDPRVKLIAQPNNTATIRVQDGPRSHDIHVRETEGVLFADQYAIHSSVNFEPYEKTEPHAVLGDIVSQAIRAGERYGGDSFLETFRTTFLRFAAQYGSWEPLSVVEGEGVRAVYAKSRGTATTTRNPESLPKGLPLGGGFVFMPKENTVEGRNRLMAVPDVYGSLSNYFRSSEQGVSGVVTDIAPGKGPKVSRLSTNDKTMFNVHGTRASMRDPVLGGTGELMNVAVLGAAFPMPVGGAFISPAVADEYRGERSQKRFPLTAEQIIAGVLEPITKFESPFVHGNESSGRIVRLLEGLSGEPEGPEMGAWKYARLDRLDITLPSAYRESDLAKRLTEATKRMKMGEVLFGDSPGIDVGLTRYGPTHIAEAKHGAVKALVAKSNIPGLVLNAKIDVATGPEAWKSPVSFKMQSTSGILQSMDLMNRQVATHAERRGRLAQVGVQGTVPVVRKGAPSFPVAGIAAALGLSSKEMEPGEIGMIAGERMFDAFFRGIYTSELAPYQEDIEAYQRITKTGARRVNTLPRTIGFVDTNGVNDMQALLYMPRVMRDNDLDEEATIAAIQRGTGASEEQARLIAGNLRDYVQGRNALPDPGALPLDLTGAINRVTVSPKTGRISASFTGLPALITPMNMAFRPSFPNRAEGVSWQQLTVLANNSPEMASDILDRALRDPKGRQIGYWESYAASQGKTLGDPMKITDLDLSSLYTRASEIMEREGGKVMSPRWELMALRELQNQQGWAGMLLTATGESMESANALLAQYADDRLTGESVSRRASRYMNVVKAHLPNSSPEDMVRAVATARGLYQESLDDYLYDSSGNLNEGIRKGMSSFFPSGRMGGAGFKVDALAVGEKMPTEEEFRKAYASLRESGEVDYPYDVWKEQFNLGEAFGAGMRWPLMQPNQASIEKVVSAEYLLREGRITKEEYRNLPKSGIGVSEGELVQRTGDTDADRYEIILASGRLDEEQVALYQSLWEKSRFANAYDFLGDRPIRYAGPMPEGALPISSAQSELYKALTDVQKFTGGNPTAMEPLLDRFTPRARFVSNDELIAAQVAETESKKAMGTHYAFPIEIPNAHLGYLPPGASQSLDMAERKRLASGLGSIAQDIVDRVAPEDQSWRKITAIMNSTIMGDKGPLVNIDDKWRPLAEVLPDAIATAIRERNEVDPIPTLDLLLRQRRGESLESALRGATSPSDIAKNVLGWDENFDMAKFLGNTAFGDILFTNRSPYIMNRALEGNLVPPAYAEIVNRWADYAFQQFRGKTPGAQPKVDPFSQLSANARLGAFGASALLEIVQPSPVQKNIPKFNYAGEARARQAILDLAVQNYPENVRAGIAAGKQVFTSEEFGRGGWNAYPIALSTRPSTLNRPYTDMIKSMLLGWDSRAGFTEENALKGGVSPRLIAEMKETYGPSFFASPNEVEATTVGKVYHLGVQRWLSFMGAEFPGVSESEQRLVAPKYGMHGTVDAALHLGKFYEAYEAASKEDRSKWTKNRAEAFGIMQTLAQNPHVMAARERGVEILNLDVKTMGRHTPQEAWKKLGEVEPQMAEYRALQALRLLKPGEQLDAQAMSRVATILALDPTGKRPEMHEKIREATRVALNEPGIDPNQLPAVILDRMSEDNPDFMNDILATFFESFRPMGRSIRFGESPETEPELEYLFGKEGEPGAIGRYGALSANVNSLFGYMKKDYTNEAFLAAQRKGEEAKLIAGAVQNIYANPQVRRFMASIDEFATPREESTWSPRKTAEAVLERYRQVTGNEPQEGPTLDAATRRVKEEAGLTTSGSAVVTSGGGVSGGLTAKELVDALKGDRERAFAYKQKADREARQAKAASQMPLESVPQILSQLQSQADELFGTEKAGGRVQRVAGTLARRKTSRDLPASVARHTIEAGKRTERATTGLEKRVAMIQDALQFYAEGLRGTDREPELEKVLSLTADASALSARLGEPSVAEARAEIGAAIGIMESRRTPLTPADERLARAWPEPRLATLLKEAPGAYAAFETEAKSVLALSAPTTADDAREQARRIGQLARSFSGLVGNVEKASSAAGIRTRLGEHLGAGGGSAERLGGLLSDLSLQMAPGHSVVDQLTTRRQALEAQLASGSLPTRTEQKAAEKEREKLIETSMGRAPDYMDVSLTQYMARTRGGGLGSFSELEKFTGALGDLRKQLIETKEKGLDPFSEATKELSKRSGYAASVFRSWEKDLSNILDVSSAQRALAEKAYSETPSAGNKEWLEQTRDRERRANMALASLRSGGGGFIEEEAAFQNIVAARQASEPPPAPPQQTWWQQMSANRRQAAGMFGGSLGALGFGLFNIERAYRWTFGALQKSGDYYAQTQQTLAQAEFQAGGDLTVTREAEMVRRQQAAPDYLRYRIGQVYMDKYGERATNLMNAISSAPDSVIGGGVTATAILGGLTVSQVLMSSMAQLTGFSPLARLGGFQLPATLAQGAWNLMTTGAVTNAGANAARTAWTAANAGARMPWILPTGAGLMASVGLPLLATVGGYGTYKGYEKAYSELVEKPRAEGEITASEGHARTALLYSGLGSGGGGGGASYYAAARLYEKQVSDGLVEPDPLDLKMLTGPLGEVKERRGDSFGAKFWRLFSGNSDYIRKSRSILGLTEEEAIDAYNSAGYKLNRKPTTWEEILAYGATGTDAEPIYSSQMRRGGKPRGPIPEDNARFIREANQFFGVKPDVAAEVLRTGNSQKGKRLTWEEFDKLVSAYNATGDLSGSLGFWTETGRRLGAVPGTDAYWNFYTRGAMLPDVQRQQIDLASQMIGAYGGPSGMSAMQMGGMIPDVTSALARGVNPNILQLDIGRGQGFSMYAQAFGFPEGSRPAQSLAQQMLGLSQTREAEKAWNVSSTEGLANALGIMSVAGKEALAAEFERRMGVSWADKAAPKGPLDFLKPDFKIAPSPQYGKSREEVLGEMIAENMAGISLNLGIDDKEVARRVEERALAIKGQPRQLARFTSALGNLRGQFPSLSDAELETEAAKLEKYSITEQGRILDIAKQSQIPGMTSQMRLAQAQELFGLPNVTDQQRGLIMQMRESMSPAAWSMAAWGGGHMQQFLSPNDPRRGSSLSMRGRQVTGGWMPLVDAMGNDWFKYNTWNINGRQYGNTYQYELNMADIESDLGIAQGRYSMYQQQWQIRNIQREYGSLSFPQTQALYGRRDKMSAQLAEQGVPADKIEAQVNQALPLNGVGLAQQEYMIRRQMWQENIAQQQASINLQREQLALAIQEYRERRAYQIEEREAGRSMTLQQRSWQRGDMLRSVGRFETQMGWSLEDMDRGIRFASGRERIDLMRQRDRFLITSGWQRDDQTRSLRRQDQTWRFEDERYDKAVRFEQRMNDIQEQRFKLQQKGLDLQQDALNKQVAAQVALQEIEDKRFTDTVTYNRGQVGHLQTILGLEAKRQSEIEKWADDFKVMRSAQSALTLGLVRYIDAVLAKLGMNTGIGDLNIEDFLPGGRHNLYPEQQGGKDLESTGDKSTGQLVVNLQVGTQILGTVVQQLHRQMHSYDARF